MDGELYLGVGHGGESCWEVRPLSCPAACAACRCWSHAQIIVRCPDQFAGVG